MPASHDPESKRTCPRSETASSAADADLDAPDAESARVSFDRALTLAGGERFLAAAAVVARLPRAVRPDSRAASRLNAGVRTQEAAALRTFAIASGCLFDGDEFERHWCEQGRMGGSENDLWYAEISGLVWKRNRIDVLHVSWRQFFERLLLHNAHFPEAPLRLEGFVESDAGLCPVFTQPDVIAGRGATRGEVASVLRERGYTPVSGDDYLGARVRVEDLHEGNVLAGPDGFLHVIDPALFVA